MQENIITDLVEDRGSAATLKEISSIQSALNNMDKQMKTLQKNLSQ